jgi:hypothetical protein
MATMIQMALDSISWTTNQYSKMTNLWKLLTQTKEPRNWLITLRTTATTLPQINYLFFLEAISAIKMLSKTMKIWTK